MSLFLYVLLAFELGNNEYNHIKPKPDIDAGFKRGTGRPNLWEGRAARTNYKRAKNVFHQKAFFGMWL